MLKTDANLYDPYNLLCVCHFHNTMRSITIAVSFLKDVACICVSQCASKEWKRWDSGAKVKLSKSQKSRQAYRMVRQVRVITREGGPIRQTSF